MSSVLLRSSLGGRHRATWLPPSTPADYWNLGFGDTPQQPQRPSQQEQEESPAF